MNSVIRKFVSRAPRYVLRPPDRDSMRFSLENTTGTSGIEETKLINLSETGAAFITSANVPLEIGERIKVEIPIPGGEQLAWWARVVRIQEYEGRNWFGKRDGFEEPSRLVIGLTFEKLPEGHTRALRKGIERSFLQAARDQRYRTFNYYKVFFFQYFLQILLYAVLTAIAFGFLYYISLPDENYDAKRGSPWGQRFKF